MRAVVQKVSDAEVDVDGQTVGSIGKGFLVYLGVQQDDNSKDVQYIADKISGLRIFEDDAGKMNLDIKDVGGQILIISAFSLLADCRKGRRPAFVNAARPDLANQLYQNVVTRLQQSGLNVEMGKFQQFMQVKSTAQGPVLPLLDSRKLF